MKICLTWEGWVLTLVMGPPLVLNSPTVSKKVYEQENKTPRCLKMCSTSLISGTLVKTPNITSPLLEWLFYLFVYLFIYFCFLGQHSRHMEVPRLGVEVELQLPAYTTATATPYLSCVCNLHHSSQQLRILNHWARPGMEPATSWFLVGFISTVPQWELLERLLSKIQMRSSGSEG